ncbi:MAG: efflux RND transporter periplasmic adaptor subunit [Rikenellaceae bacterium]
MSKIRVILSIAVLFVITSCKDQQTNKKRAPEPKVEVISVKVDSLYHRINIASQIKALNNATIQPRVNGFLLETHYLGGAPVKQGELLFTIDPSTFSTSLYSAKASLESARASEVLAQRNFERAKPLASIEAISQSDLDQYNATYKAARASTKSAEEALRSAQLEIGYTKIYSPISGIATKTAASRGDYIGPGTLESELCTISQMDTICVELPIATAKYLNATSSSTKGSFDNQNLLSDISMKLTDSTTYEYPGQYYYTLKDTPQGSSTVVILVKFPNPELKLKEGMFARVAANIGERKGEITVPKTAVSQLQGVNSVWIIAPDSTAQWRKVSLGDSFGEKWAILSGLEEGDKIVVSGVMKLRNGMKVASTTAK